MKEKAKEILLGLKQKDKVLASAFNEYVELLVSSLEIPKDIAITLVTSELVNKYQKELILRDLFSKSTLEENNF
ncbi:MAG: hypothetical protein IJW43_00035 [Clostridia bacterium]|nr:hypothetical protein [Clostridia bacterium]